MASRRRVGAAIVNVDGSPLTVEEYDNLVDTRVEQSVHVPDRFSMRFRDPNFLLMDSDTFGIGRAVDIGISDGDHEVPVARGEITAIAVEEGATGRHELVVSGLDRAHRLARGRKVRTFANVTDAEVAQHIARERGLRAEVDRCTLQHEYLLQRGTDYEFLDERARAVGFGWWVNGDTLYFREEVQVSSGPTLEFGANLARFKVRASCAEFGSDVVVRGWDPNTQQPIVGTAPMDAQGAALGTDASLVARAVAGASAFGDDTRRGTGDVGVSSVMEAQALAQSLASSASAEFLVAKGEAIGNPSLRAGAEVEVRGVGSRLAGHYVLTSVEHVLGAGRHYVTRFVSGGRHPDTLVDLLGGRSSAAGWGERGLVIGVVTNNRDPERLRRVKVRFPTLNDDDESSWARVAAVGAGLERGFSVRHEVGDEVLVGFEQGDVRRPIVLGGLWSKQNRPNDQRDGNESDEASHVWRSGGGHRVEMHDADSQAGSFVAVTLADGRTRLRLGEDDITLESPSDVTITAAGDLRLQARGDVSLEGANVFVKAKRTAKVDAGGTFSARGTTKALVEGAQTEVRGSGTVTVQGGSVAAVKGTVVKLN